MKIAVLGAGAMGSIYAARLAASGNDVLAVTLRQEHVDAINRYGLKVSSPAGEIVARLRATTTVSPETMDLVVLSMKASDVADGARSALPLLSEKTVVLTIQNGLGSGEEVASIVGARRLAIGIASGFGASVVAPGHIHHNAMQAIRMGPYFDLPYGQIEEVASIWQFAGFDAKAVNDIIAMQWEKLICNVAYSAPCALTGMTVGQVMEDPQMGAVSRAAAVEAWHVARAIGVAIDVIDPIAHVRAFGARMPDAKPSALQDHEAQRVSEIDVINGAIPREARKVGLDTPVNDTLVALVKAKERNWAH